jgi:hypothetical protein
MTVDAVLERPLVDDVREDASVEDGRLRLALRIAWISLGVQLLAMMLWSSLLYTRWGNTWDFAIRYQAWWGIAHGNLDPYVSVAHRYFWQDHFELINWPLAPISRLWPGSLWTLWIQDLMVVGGEFGALYLVVDAVRRPRWPVRFPGWMAVGLVAVLLVANPWIYDSISFDFHYQSVGAACFAMLACREMIRGRLKLLVLWVVLCLACGDIAGTYLAAVGVGGIVVGRQSRQRGAVLLALGLGWFLFATVLGGGQGSGLAGHYGYLSSGPTTASAPLGVSGLAKGLLVHPWAVVQHMWVARSDLWAYSASSGVLGLFTGLSALPLLVLVEGGAGQGPSLRTIAYENFGAVLFIAPLSVLALAWLSRQLTTGWLATHLAKIGFGAVRWTRVPIVIGALMAANAVIWGVVWIPQVRAQWLQTTPAAASALNQAESMIPPTAEVVASQGVMGRLCGRQWCYEIAGNGTQHFPLKTGDTYFVVVPYQGVETSSVQTQLGMIQDLAGPLHAELLLARKGVWLFKVARPLDRDTVVFDRSPTEPAWAAQTATGRPVLQGPASDWAMTLGNSKPGYVLYGADWNLLPGDYQATVTMASTVPTEVETWDSTAGVLLGRRTVTPTNGHATIQTTFDVSVAGIQKLYSGWGPFSYSPAPPQTPADRIEIRIWSGGGAGEVSVYSTEIEPYRP